MSGKTSETRCAKCYFLACPCAGRGVCGCVCHSEPTPPEGEAVPEQKETKLICDGCNVRSPFEHRCHGSRSVVAGEFTNLPCECLECKEPPAPVVSTAAPEPDEPQWFQKKPVKIRALQWTGNNEDEMGRFMPGKFTISDSGARLFIATLEGTMEAQVLDWIICGVKGEFYPCKPEIFEASYTPVAPESYKSAEGPTCGKPAASLIPRLGMSWACALQKTHEGACAPGGTCVKHGKYICRPNTQPQCPKWPDCITPAATPVTVEAPERPEWFNFIRVRQRTNLSTKQTDFVASFGPRNILTPEADAETMEQKLEMVKEWLWLFMNKKQ